MKNRVMKNNPAFLDRADLIRGFVVRQADLKLLTERLYEHTDGPCQHILVIAPRGMGKTTLVLRVVADVELDSSLSRKWYPIVFSEESYEVATAAELWLEAVRHLGRQTKDKRWLDAYEVLRAERNEQRLYERALGRLMDFADEQGKKLLVVVENLNMILGEQVSRDDGWTLRHTLQNEPRIMLLATATSRFDEIDNADMAMYELFWTFDLLPLNTDECRTVWKALTGHELAGDRIRPVEILTGGSPRLLSILASFASEMSLRELMDNLAHLVDEHTSYFKSNLEGLPAAERKVYVTLADMWRPATAREVAEAARIDVNKSSGFLSRLMQRGAVAEARKEGRTIWYQVTERLYNIYHLLRKHTSEEGRVRWFVEFMIEYYDHDKIVDVVRTIADEACDTEPTLRLNHFFVYSGVVKHFENDERARKILAATNPRFFQMEDAPDFIKELPGRFGVSTSHQIKPGQSEAEVWRLVRVAIEYYNEKHLVEAEAIAQSALKLDDAAWGAYFVLTIVYAWQERFEEAEKILAQLASTAPQHVGWEYAAAILWTRRGFFEMAIPMYQRALEKEPGMEPWWVEYGKTCELFEDWEAAEVAYLRATALNPANSDTWFQLCRVQGILKKVIEAELSARTALQAHPDDLNLWRCLVFSLLDQQKFTDECEVAIHRAMSPRVDDNEILLFGLATFHQARIQNTAEALRAARRYGQFDKGRYLFLASLAIRVISAEWSGVLAEAESWARTAVEMEPTAAYLRMPLALVLWVSKQRRQALEEAQNALRDLVFVEKNQPLILNFFVDAAATGLVSESLAILSESPAAGKLEPLITALQVLDGQTPNAPTEILEVAKDIVKQVDTLRVSMATTTTKPPPKKSTTKKPKTKARR